MQLLRSESWFNMIKIGRFNELEVVRKVDFGVYLAEHSEAATKILLPRKYVADDLEIGDKIKVFIYLDSEDRIVATTEQPFAQVGEIKLLKCIDANKIGAFFDWASTNRPKLFSLVARSALLIFVTPSRCSSSPFEKTTERFSGSWLLILDRYVSRILNSDKLISERQRDKSGVDF